MSLSARRQDAERGDDLRALRVVLAHDGGLHHGRVLDEHAFDLERPDAVGARGDHVVVAPLEPEVAVRVQRRLVAGEVERPAERFGGRAGVAVVAGEQADRDGQARQRTTMFPTSPGSTGPPSSSTIVTS